MANILIVSLRPLSPVKSGFQNTVHLLNKALKKKFNTKFLLIDNENDIDPVINLDYSNSFAKKLDEAIIKFSPRFIFVNTSKLLYLYNKVLFKNDNRIILICHDLYFFRKKYFRKNNLLDSTSITKKQEVSILSQCKYIIDFAHYEYEFLIRNNIEKSKLFFTMTPVKVYEFNYSEKRLYDFFYIGSKWHQNTVSLNYFFKHLFEFLKKKKVLVIGPKLQNHKSKNFIYSSSLNNDDYSNSKIGIAPIFEGTGRNVKIFDMMANSLPVVTNKDLSSYGLKSGHHYILVNNIKDWQDELIKLEDSYQLRKLIAFNGWNWVKENCNDRHVFNSLITKLD
jgi:hypothetical protein